jgi:hypothetical protein
MKNKWVWGGPLVLTILWTGGALACVGQATRWSIGWPLMVGLICVVWGSAGLAVLVAGGYRQWKKNQRSKMTLWSAGRPGEMMVGVVHTGDREPVAGGLKFILECFERGPVGEWLLWSADSDSPTPSSEDTWPFHFSLPMEAPPSGPSPDGDVLWRVRAQSKTPGRFEGEWTLVVSPNMGPASKLLPVPLPAAASVKRGPPRTLFVSQGVGQTRFSLPSPFVFPGPNPLVIWALSLTAFFMVMVRMKAPLWAVVGGALLNLGAALVLVAQWFGREEVCVDPVSITVRRCLGPFRRGRSFSRSTVLGVRVVFSGGPNRYGVRIDRSAGLRPWAAFGGFQNHLEAHEVARALLRCLNQKNPSA